MSFSLSNIIKTTDYFAKPVEINFDKQRTFKTVFGGIISIMIYLTTLSFTIALGREIIDKRNLRTTSTTTYNLFAPYLNVTQSRRIFIFEYLDVNYKQFYDDSYFKIVVNQFQVKRDGGSVDISNKELKLTKCIKYRDQFVKANLSQNFESNRLGEALCIDLDQNNVILGGGFIEKSFHNIAMKLIRCRNDTDIVCKSRQEIDAKVKGGFIQLYYIDNNIDLNDFSTPFTKYLSEYFTLIDPGSLKVVDLFFKTVSIVSDFGLIFEDKEKLSELLFDRYREQIDTSALGDTLLELYINSSGYSTIYTRNYMKLQEIAANIGGMMKIMLLIGSIITSNVSRVSMFEAIVNSLFFFKIKDEIYKGPRRIETSGLSITMEMKGIKTNSEMIIKSDNNLHNVHSSKINLINRQLYE